MAKLLLIEDVEDLGRSGDLVNVKPGFARNFLLPRGFAVIADPNTIRRQNRLQEERRQKAIVDKQESESLAAKLEGQVVSVTVKVDHDGHMYGSVTALDIVHLIEGQIHLKVEKRNVVLKHAIKDVGDHAVTIRLKEEIAAQITLKVVAEGSAQA